MIGPGRRSWRSAREIKHGCGVTGLQVYEKSGDFTTVKWIFYCPCVLQWPAAPRVRERSGVEREWCCRVSHKLALHAGGTSSKPERGTGLHSPAAGAERYERGSGRVLAGSGHAFPFLEHGHRKTARGVVEGGGGMHRRPRGLPSPHLQDNSDALEKAKEHQMNSIFLMKD